MRENNIFFRKQPDFSTITPKSVPTWLFTEVYIRSDTEKKEENEKVGTKRFWINRFVALFQHRNFYSQLFCYFSRIYRASDWTQYWCRISLGHSQKRIQLLSQISYSTPPCFYISTTELHIIHWMSWYHPPLSFILFLCDELFTQRWLKGDLDFFLCVRHFSSVFIPVFGWRPSYSAELYLPLGCNVIYKYEACFPYYITTVFLSKKSTFCCIPSFILLTKSCPYLPA